MKMTEPLISIIVPIYNVEAYLRECIDSVLAQTFSDFELILVDDGSPDNCGAICDQYAERDSRIRVIHKANGGLSDARNAGLDIAVGKYVYFLDSDDSVVPELLQTVIPRMEEGNDLVAFRLQTVYSNGRIELPKKGIFRQFYLRTPEDKRQFIHSTLLPSRIGWEACTRVFLREKIERYGLRFADNRVIFAEDLYFSLCYCAHAEQICCIEEILYNYRIRNDSIMSTQSKKSSVGRVHQLAKKVLEYYSQFEDCAGLVEHFSTIYYQIMAGQFLFQLWTSDKHPLEFREESLGLVEDPELMKKWLCKQLENRTELKKYYSPIEEMELYYHIQFLLGGSWLRLRLQCKLIRMFRPLLDSFGK